MTEDRLDCAFFILPVGLIFTPHMSNFRLSDKGP